MIVRTDARSILTAFFRQKRKFLVVFLTIFVAGLCYVRTATPEYQSTAKLLIKFGQEARPEISQNAAVDGASADEHREIVQSNVNILASRDLGETLIKDTTIERAYPALVANTLQSPLKTIIKDFMEEITSFIGNVPAHATVMDMAYKHYTDDLVIKTENDSDIISIGLFNQDSKVAQAMLHHLIDLFITRQSEVYANPQTTILRQQADTAKAKLDDAQKRLYAFKGHAGSASADEELTLLLKERSDLAQEKSTRQRIYSHYTTTPGDGIQDPDVQAINGQMGGLDRKISGTVQRKAQSDDLMREVRLDEDNYRAAQMRAEEAEANQSLNQQKITRVSVIEQPSLPYKATRPWKSVILLLCLIIGVALGISVCILAESFDKSFSQPEQAAVELGIPVVASFAYSRVKRARR